MLEKLLTILNGTITKLALLMDKQGKAQSAAQDKLLRQIGDLAEQVKKQAPVVNVEPPKVEVTVPEIKIPEAKVKVEIPPINVPKPEVTVNLPEQKAPVVNVPAPVVNIEAPTEIEVKGLAKLFKSVTDALKSVATYSLWNDVAADNPVPVVLVTPDGKKYTARSGAVPVGGGGGMQGESIAAFVGNFALRLDDTSTPNVTYVGKAAIAEATSAPSWQIRKIDETSGLVITWADGNATFDNIWNNRTSLTYS